MATASTPAERATPRERDAGVALAVLLSTYALGNVGFPPGYFLIASFDIVQNPLWPGLGGTAFEIAVFCYCCILAIVGAVVTSRVRVRVREPSRGAEPTERWWAGGVAGACFVLGLLAFGFALFVALAGAVTPALIGGGTAAALVGVGWYVLRR
ncbi:MULTISPECIES: hypothetical protein [Halorussus]|uniref:hypothetical protein n=1 Tax=Halorussus TaxID=1070314 RepID=UPI00209F1372|nr:hypothetical protein [Halorussus vallis]USZ74744.1 hypothetical protein NGM07_15035 [Halorussus vallis]